MGAVDLKGQNEIKICSREPRLACKIHWLMLILFWNCSYFVFQLFMHRL